MEGLDFFDLSRIYHGSKLVASQNFTCFAVSKLLYPLRSIPYYCEDAGVPRTNAHIFFPTIQSHDW